MPGQVETLDLQNTNRVRGPGDDKPKDLSIEALLRLIMFESTENLRLQKINELKKLSTSQSEIGFLSNLRRIFMLGGNEDGTFTVNEELKKLLEKVSNPGSENLMQLLEDLGLSFDATYSDESFNKVFAGIEGMTPAEGQALREKLTGIGIEKGKVPTPAQLKELVKLAAQSENLKLRKLLTDNNILTTKSKFTKPERENFIESIRLATDQKNTLNEMTIQTISQHQTQIDQRQQYVIMAAKIYNDILKSIGQKIGK
jgi:hypothetical protein